MLIRTIALTLVCCGIAGCAAPADNGASTLSEPLVIGETFTIDSRIMGETRRMNVLVPSIYGEKPATPFPVLYMLDGGINEDFLHVAGLVQILVSNGGMRPFMLVGIENTSRRRDVTGPTSNPKDRENAPVVGGSETFRRFIKEELMPAVNARYRTTGETAIIGESLAGLFVVETYFLEPSLFSTYIALDPSVWWNNAELVNAAAARLVDSPAHGTSMFLASSNEPDLTRLTAQLAGAFEAHRASDVKFEYRQLPTETHATLYHPAALVALRSVFAPPPVVAK